MKSSFIFLVLILLIISGNNKINGQLLTFDLKKLPDKTSLKLSEIGAYEIKYIPLETNEQNPIKEIRKIIFGKDYFLTQYFTEIFMFKYDGSFINRIGHVGRGPNEFTTAHDVDINPQNQSIYIADGWLQKFLVFNKNGDIIRVFKSPLKGPMDFTFSKDGILCYYGNHMGIIETSYILIDTLGKIIKSYPNHYPWKRTAPNVAFMGENLFYHFNDNMYKKEIYSDTIYTFLNKGFKPHLVIDVGKFRLTPEKREENDYKYILDNFLIPVCLFEFGNCIYYEFILPSNEKNDGLSFVGSKNNKTKFLFDSEPGLINDIDGGPNIRPKTGTDNTIVSWIDAFKFKQTVESKSLRPPPSLEKNTQQRRLPINIKETDNPIIIMVKIK